RRVLLPLCTEPAPVARSSLSLHDALPIYGHVGLVAVPRQPDFLAVETVIVEAVFLHRILGGRIDAAGNARPVAFVVDAAEVPLRSEEHTSELQSRENLVCRLLLEKKKSQ